ncbi:hypothetical protein RWV98_05630 [Agathobaculum sp. NTUH-O15-33]|uniref:DUF4376 domain-containing protein n=1 Tax=Agathobaculum sp. NTUH-O15-33 TaxID=3079302 RepID=UPI0029587865|nr:hypothetical protein [Agathobaculum sp. NTUH-O15-33]WNX85748.1 hypothetical protein RWV98_05630 [Agathobaculum sp. NTUH-O15-33]
MTTIIHNENKWIQSQSHRELGENWEGDEWISVPEELAAKAFEYAPWCDLVIENGVLVDIVPVERPLDDELRADKLRELSKACNNTITAGCDVTLIDGTKGHIALTLEDQMNLSTAKSAVDGGATQYPYHIDGQLCGVFAAADIITMAQGAMAHKLYHTTYYNHLAKWVRRCETVAELNVITYGTALPDDLAEHMAGVLGSGA